MRYYLLAGEASGDLHGSGLVRALKELDPEADVRAWGGEKMEEAGAQLEKHYSELAFMGFIEVIQNLPTIMRNFKLAKRSILDFAPDVLILIDYPGFNLRMAKWAAAQGIRVHYYISPQLWAWKEGRVESIRRYVERLYVILPFEKAFYAKHGVEVEYVGHPLLEAMERFNAQSRAVPAKNCIALLAGSRAQEVKHSLPVMLQVAERMPDCHFRIAAAPHVPESLYQKCLDKSGCVNVTVHQGQTYEILSQAQAAITTSGTATLETALFGVPQVVCYKGNALSFQIAKRLVKVPYISLVNLIAEGPVVEELIQENFNPAKVTSSLERILEEPMRGLIQEQYLTLRHQLDCGGASRRVASAILNALQMNHGTV